MTTKEFKRKVSIEHTKERLQRKVEELRDIRADVKRAIDMWESMGFDATEGYDRYAHLAWEIGECLDWLDEHNDNL